MANYDFNDASARSFETIPSGTRLPVIVHVKRSDEPDFLHTANDKRSRGAQLEFTVTSGPYEHRKIFDLLMLESKDPSDDGHKQAIDMNRGAIRTMLEVAHGFATADESPAAQAARNIQTKGIVALDGIECTIVVRVQPAKDQYPEKNRFGWVVPFGAKETAGKPAAGKPTAAAPTTKKPAPGW